MLLELRACFDLLYFELSHSAIHEYNQRRHLSIFAIFHVLFSNGICMWLQSTKKLYIILFDRKYLYYLKEENKLTALNNI